MADLSFSHFKKSGNAYEVAFLSNLDLDALYAPEKDEKVVSRRLTCSLDKDQNFSVDHSFQRYLRGDVTRVTSKEPTTYSYTSQADFFKSFDNDTSREYIGEPELKELLSKTQSVPCKVVMTVYMKSPYYSSTMSIPSTEILKALSPAK